MTSHSTPNPEQPDLMMKDWDSLSSEWQSYEPDIQNIKKKISWVTWRMWFILVLDVIFLVAYFPAIYYLIANGESGWVENSWYYVGGVFLIFGVYWDFKIRLPILRCEGESTRDVLDFYLKRTRAGESIGRIGKNFGLWALGLFIIWVMANKFLEAGEPRITELNFILFGTGWISGLIAVCIWYQRKKRKELKELCALWKDYLE